MVFKNFFKLLISCFVCWQIAAPTSTALIQSKYYSYRQPSFDGTGKYYMGREIAQVMGHQGSGWLERPDRATEEQPQKMIAALELKSTDVVADIGAGTGYISQLIAQQVPEGKVLAVDVQPEMIELLKQRIQNSKITNIQTQLGTEQSPELPAESIDVAIMVDAYHEFSYPHEMIAGIVAALKPGGRVILTEYRGEDPKVLIKPHHKTTQKQIQYEMKDLGLTLLKNESVLPQQHLFFFGKSSGS